MVERLRPYPVEIIIEKEVSRTYDCNTTAT
jgi:hypothetical protein